jgi:hypothetical protein
MSWWNRRLAPQGGQTDRGASLVLVVTSFALLFALVLVTALYVVRSVAPTAKLEREEQALAAAESGITDFIARASGTTGYWLTTDCANVAMRRDLSDQTAAGEAVDCGWGDGTENGWLSVETGLEVTTGTEPAFHYEVLDYAERDGSQAGSLTVRVTGRAHGVYRTLDSEVVRESTEQFAGFQDYWTSDPQGFLDRMRDYGVTSIDSSGLGNVCPLNTTNGFGYLWSEDVLFDSDYYGSFNCRNTAIGAAKSSDWDKNTWVGSVTGDFFSNDIPFLNANSVSMGGAYDVDGTVTVANPTCDASNFGTEWVDGVGAATVSMLCGGIPAYRNAGKTVATTANVRVTEEPQTSSTLYHLPTDTSALLEAPGCRYYGATRIVLLGEVDGVGKMRVWSKGSDHAGLTTAVQPTYDTDVTVDCGSGSDLSSDEGALVTVPEGMVVQVLDIPADVVERDQIKNSVLLAGEIGGNARYGWLPTGDAVTSADLTVENLGAGYLVDVLSGVQPRMYRTEGNLWLEGELKGSVTMGTEGSVVITGDVLMVDGTGPDSEDQLGIVAGSVEVMHKGVYRYGQVRQIGGEVTLYGWAGSRHYRYQSTSDNQGELGEWPHDYSGDAGEIRIQAAIQAVTYALNVSATDSCPAYSWFTSYMDSSFSAYPTSGQPRLVIEGSLAQRFLGLVGARGEDTGASRGNNAPTGDCGVSEVSVEYDARLQDSTPPYLLRFTDSPWTAGDTSEVATPERLQG